jgi:hypothetical protein
VSDQKRARTNGADADGEVVWSWHPLLMLNRRRQVGPTGLRHAISVDDGDKKEFVAGESTKETVKTIAQEMPGVPVNLW